jgi:hypothetical protein
MPDPVGLTIAATATAITAADKGPGLVKKILAAIKGGGKVSVTDLTEKLEAYTREARREAFIRYKKILDDKRLRTLALEGLLLREVENQPQEAQTRRDYILLRWGVEGLWVAEAVQMNVIDTMHVYLVGRGQLEAEIGRVIREFFESIADRSVFVRADEKLSTVQARIRLSLSTRQPLQLLVAGAGEARKVTAKALESERRMAISYDVLPMPRDNTAGALFMFNPSRGSGSASQNLDKSSKKST